jgi:hypothetical protein
VSQLPAELLPVIATIGTGGQRANLSCRAQVGTGDGVIIPGIVLSGAAARAVLVRAVGPGLSPFGVVGVLADPTITVLRGGTRRSRLTTTGAFAFAAGSKDSAGVLTLVLLCYVGPGFTLRFESRYNLLGYTSCRVIFARQVTEQY